MPWAKRATKPVAPIGVRTTDLEVNDYSKGVNTYIANDVLKDGLWRVAQDARISSLGEYQTRQGCDFHTDAAGETLDINQTSTTGAADQTLTNTIRLAKKFTNANAGRLTKIEPRLKNDASGTGTILLEIYSDSGGSPGTLLATTSISGSTPTSSYAYIAARLVAAPQVAAATAYWAVAYIQATAGNNYKWSSTTNATTAKVSTDGGVTWSATSYDLNFKTYVSTDSPPKGLHRANKSDGTKRTILWHGTVAYGADDVTGALTSLKTGLSANATKYRGAVVNDILYYVNGFDGIRKLSGASFATEAQVTATNATIVVEHKGLLFFTDATDPNKVFYSNFADYETFTSTDFIYVPSPKTGDPVVAMASLNGALILWTRNNKYVLYGEDNATFTLAEAPGQKGTYTQETVAVDKNYAYFLSDDGVYKFNGTTDELLSESNFEDIKTITAKEDVCVAINKGRLYVYFSAPGAAANNKCYIYNLNFDCFESVDTNAYVAFATTGFNDEDKLFVASSIVGQVYYQELASNDYDNLGGLLNFELRTHYMTFGKPSVYKQIRYLKVRFQAQSGAYNVSIKYAYDFRDNWTSITNMPVQGTGTLWGSGTWGSFTWGTTSEVEANNYVPGEYKRIALQYSHSAARQPHNFYGNTFVAAIRRMK